MLKNGKTEIYNIPLDERIYVMEDIDCDNDILLDRNLKAEKRDYNNFTEHHNSFESRYEDFHFGQNQFANFNVSEDKQKLNNNLNNSLIEI